MARFTAIMLFSACFTTKPSTASDPAPSTQTTYFFDVKRICSGYHPAMSEEEVNTLIHQTYEGRTQQEIRQQWGPPA